MGESERTRGGVRKLETVGGTNLSRFARERVWGERGGEKKGGRGRAANLEERLLLRLRLLP